MEEDKKMRERLENEPKQTKIPEPAKINQTRVGMFQN